MPETRAQRAQGALVADALAREQAALAAEAMAAAVKADQARELEERANVMRGTAAGAEFALDALGKVRGATLRPMMRVDSAPRSMARSKQTARKRGGRAPPRLMKPPPRPNFDGDDTAKAAAAHVANFDASAWNRSIELESFNGRACSLMYHYAADKGLIEIESCGHLVGYVRVLAVLGTTLAVSPPVCGERGDVCHFAYDCVRRLSPHGFIVCYDTLKFFEAFHDGYAYHDAGLWTVEGAQTLDMESFTRPVDEPEKMSALTYDAFAKTKPTHDQWYVYFYLSGHFKAVDVAACLMLSVFPRVPPMHLRPAFSEDTSHFLHGLDAVGVVFASAIIKSVKHKNNPPFSHLHAIHDQCRNGTEARWSGVAIVRKFVDALLAKAGTGMSVLLGHSCEDLEEPTVAAVRYLEGQVAGVEEMVRLVDKLRGQCLDSDDLAYARHSLVMAKVMSRAWDAEETPDYPSVVEAPRPLFILGNPYMHNVAANNTPFVGVNISAVSPKNRKLLKGTIGFSKSGPNPKPLTPARPGAGAKAVSPSAIVEHKKCTEASSGSVAAVKTSRTAFILGEPEKRRLKRHQLTLELGQNPMAVSFTPSLVATREAWAKKNFAIEPMGHLTGVCMRTDTVERLRAKDNLSKSSTMREFTVYQARGTLAIVALNAIRLQCYSTDKDGNGSCSLLVTLMPEEGSNEARGWSVATATSGDAAGPVEARGTMLGVEALAVAQWVRAFIDFRCGELESTRFGVHVLREAYRRCVGILEEDDAENLRVPSSEALQPLDGAEHLTVSESAAALYKSHGLCVEGETLDAKDKYSAFLAVLAKELPRRARSSDTNYFFARCLSYDDLDETKVGYENVVIWNNCAPIREGDGGNLYGEEDVEPIFWDAMVHHEGKSVVDCGAYLVVKTKFGEDIAPRGAKVSFKYDDDEEQPKLHVTQSADYAGWKKELVAVSSSHFPSQSVENKTQPNAWAMATRAMQDKAVFVLPVTLKGRTRTFYFDFGGPKKNVSFKQRMGRKGKGLWWAEHDSEIDTPIASHHNRALPIRVFKFIEMVWNSFSTGPMLGISGRGGAQFEIAEKWDYEDSQNGNGSPEMWTMVAIHNTVLSLDVAEAFVASIDNETYLANVVQTTLLCSGSAVYCDVPTVRALNTAALARMCYLSCSSYPFLTERLVSACCEETNASDWSIRVWNLVKGDELQRRKKMTPWYNQRNGVYAGVKSLVSPDFNRQELVSQLAKGWFGKTNGALGIDEIDLLLADLQEACCEIPKTSAPSRPPANDQLGLEGLRVSAAPDSFASPKDLRDQFLETSVQYVWINAKTLKKSGSKSKAAPKKVEEGLVPFGSTVARDDFLKILKGKKGAKYRDNWVCLYGADTDNWGVAGHVVAYFERLADENELYDPRQTIYEELAFDDKYAALVSKDKAAVANSGLLRKALVNKKTSTSAFARTIEYLASLAPTLDDKCLLAFFKRTKEYGRAGYVDSFRTICTANHAAVALAIATNEEFRQVWEQTLKQSTKVPACPSDLFASARAAKEYAMNVVGCFRVNLSGGGANRKRVQELERLCVQALEHVRGNTDDTKIQKNVVGKHLLERLRVSMSAGKKEVRTHAIADNPFFEPNSATAHKKGVERRETIRALEKRIDGCRTKIVDLGKEKDKLGKRPADEGGGKRSSIEKLEASIRSNETELAELEASLAKSTEEEDLMWRVVEREGSFSVEMDGRCVKGGRKENNDGRIVMRAKDLVADVLKTPSRYEDCGKLVEYVKDCLVSSESNDDEYRETLKTMTIKGADVPLFVGKKLTFAPADVAMAHTSSPNDEYMYEPDEAVVDVVNEEEHKVASHSDGKVVLDDGNEYAEWLVRPVDMPFTPSPSKVDYDTVLMHVGQAFADVDRGGDEATRIRSANKWRKMMVHAFIKSKEARRRAVAGRGRGIDNLEFARLPHVTRLAKDVQLWLCNSNVFNADFSRGMLDVLLLREASAVACSVLAMHGCYAKGGFSFVDVLCWHVVLKKRMLSATEEAREAVDLPFDERVFQLSNSASYRTEYTRGAVDACVDAFVKRAAPSGGRGYWTALNEYVLLNVGVPDKEAGDYVIARTREVEMTTVDTDAYTSAAKRVAEIIDETNVGVMTAKQYRVLFSRTLKERFPFVSDDSWTRFKRATTASGKNQLDLVVHAAQVAYNGTPKRHSKIRRTGMAAPKNAAAFS